MHPSVADVPRKWDDALTINSSAEKVKIKAHGETLDIQGIVIAKVNDKLQLESIDVWFDPFEMFRQIDQKNEEGAESAAAGCPFAGAANKE